MTVIKHSMFVLFLSFCGCSYPGKIAIFNNSNTLLVIRSGQQIKSVAVNKIVYFPATKSADPNDYFTVFDGVANYTYEFPTENIWNYSNFNSKHIYFQINNNKYLFLVVDRSIKITNDLPLPAERLKLQPKNYPLIPKLR